MELFLRYIDNKYLLLKDDKGVQIQIFITLMLYVSILAHVVLCAYFLIVQDLPYLFAALTGGVLFFTALVINKLGKVRIACFMFVSIILLNSFWTAYLFGPDVGSRFMVLVAIVPTILYFDFTIKKNLFYNYNTGNNKSAFNSTGALFPAQPP